MPASIIASSPSKRIWKKVYLMTINVPSFDVWKVKYSWNSQKTVAKRQLFLSKSKGSWAEKWHEFELPCAVEEEYKLLQTGDDSMDKEGMWSLHAQLMSLKITADSVH